jgi:hypothetical protein
LRKNPRKHVKYQAQIILGNDEQPQPCALSDVSQSGARLVVMQDNELPEYFTLLLSATGRSGRYCKMVWRNGRELGVQFVRAQEMPGFVEKAKNR